MGISGLRQSFKTKSKTIISAAAILSLLATPLLTAPVSAATNTVCAAGCTYTTVQDAVTGSLAGDTIDVIEGQTVTSTVVVNKQLTITSSNGSDINTTGSNTVLNVTANGTVIQNLDFNKSDNLNQNMVLITADNVTVSGNSFNGIWTIGGGTVVRGIVVSPNRVGLAITGNDFSNLRQPAYIDGTTSGTISGNSVSHTKGWVVESSTNLTFSGNTWGDGVNTNVIDIAIIPSAVNNYPDVEVVSISDDNDNALVENQFGGARLSDAYVIPVANGNVGDGGSKWNPYTSIQAGLNRIVEGGTVSVADGTYNESFTFAKNGTKLVGESKAGVQINSNGITPNGHAIAITGLNNIEISNATFNVGAVGNPGYHLKVYQVSGITLSNLDFNGRGTAYIPRTGGVDFNATSNVVMSNVNVSNYSKNGVAVTSKYAGGDIASQNYTFSNVNVSNSAWHGFAFYPFSSAVNDDITNVVFTGANSTIGNGQTGVIFAGASDPDMALGNAATRTVSGPGGSEMNIDALAISGNTLADIVNYQTLGVSALGSLLNGKTGNAMTTAERTTQDGLITDNLDNAQLGLVTYYNAPAVDTGTGGAGGGDSGSGSGSGSTGTSAAFTILASNTTSTFTNALGLAGGFGAAAAAQNNDNKSEVEGAKDNNKGQTSSDSTKKDDDSKYTWLWLLALVLAALAGLLWWLLAYRRRKNEEE